MVNKLRVWACGIAAAMAFGATAAAETFTVVSTTDAVDAKPGDGKCATAAGECTLRAAVQEANAAGEEDDMINLLAGRYALTIPPSGGLPNAGHGDLDLFGKLSIHGVDAANTVIDGGGNDRVFGVQTDSTVTISDVTVRNGAALAGEPGGGIRNEGTLTLVNTVVEENKTKSDETESDSAPGGGIHSSGILRLRKTVVRGNEAADEGGGIFSAGTLTMTESRVEGNASLTDDGGGVANRGRATLIISTIDGNRAAGGGGGIDNLGNLIVTHSTLSNNRAQKGGAIHNRDDLIMTDSTLAVNEAYTTGGALENDEKARGSLNNVTIAANTAGRDAQGKPVGGGVFNAEGSKLQVSNSIVATNKAPGAEAPDCAGAVSSLGYNLVTDPAGCTNVGERVGGVLGADPKLGPLADNGGPTKTMALLEGSPAINAGNPAPPGSDGKACQKTDQRGVPRPAEGTSVCDIGAFEFGGKVPIAP